jgi:hypothetical protein
MTDCNKNKFLVRDGTNQQNRYLKALDSNYVKIDERSFKDLLKFIEDFSDVVQYYNDSNVPEESWKPFFSLGIENIADKDLKKYLKNLIAQNEPHIALTIAFLLLFKYVQNQLNGLTQKHIDYYYKDVLKLKPKPSTPDKAHVLFTLAKHVNFYRIEKGTELLAGKDQSGKMLFYKVLFETVINQATIGKLKTVFKDDQGRVYCAPVANSADGKGKEIGEKQWSAFGKAQKIKKDNVYVDVESRTMDDAPIGFAIASPVLWLQEGKRTVTLTLTCKENIKRSPKDVLNNPLKGDFLFQLAHIKGADDSYKIPGAFLVKVSGKKGWIEKKIVADGTIKAKNSIEITFVLEASDPAVTAYDEALYKEGYQVGLPMIKVILNNETGNYAYNNLKDLTLQGVKISVDVKGIRSLYVQNNHSVLDSTKTFQPYGSSPSIGDEFYIGQAEVFQKKLDNFKLTIEWQNAPVDFAVYYQDYYASKPQNTEFTCELKLRYKKDWKSLVPLEHYLFNPTDTRTKPPTDYDPAKRVIYIENIAKNLNDSSYQTDIIEEEIKSYGPATVNGFIKLRLSGPVGGPNSITAFGHKDYPAIYTERILNKTNQVTSETIAEALKKTSAPTVQSAKVTEEYQTSKLKESQDVQLKQVTSGLNTVLPKEPYTPSIRSLFIDYGASEILLDVENPQNSSLGKFFHIGPFGHEEFATDGKTDLYLLPQIDFQGALYIGISKFSPPQQLSLLFQVAEGSGDLSKEKRPAIKWQYLVGNVWVDFQPVRILMDTTQELRNSGMIVFDVPKEANASHSIIDQDYHWLKASVDGNSVSINNIIQISTQAALVGFTDKGNDPGHLGQPLPAKSITKLAVNNSAIKSVEQPFASYGGKITEQSGDFYPRVSERLRHKNRAITIWDYERLVLEQFPSVYKVKCLNHTDKDGEIKAGCVTLVVISNLYNKNAVDPLRPLTSEGERTQIEVWLNGKFTQKGLISPFVTLAVKNPVFEEIEVSFSVKFKEGLDDSYTAQLNADIKKFLSPWAYKAGEDIIFEGKIHKSLIVYYVEKLPYVEFITNFLMNQTRIENSKLLDIETAEATRPDVVLVSASNHIISNLGSDYECKTSL